MRQLATIAAFVFKVSIVIYKKQILQLILSLFRMEGCICDYCAIVVEEMTINCNINLYE